MLKNYLILATRSDVLIRLLLRHGVSARNILPLLVLIQSGFWSSFLAFREQMIAGKKISRAPVPHDPIFIIGHWRTGSTFLHQLFQQDPRCAAPTLLQCTYPDSFMTARMFIAPVMRHFLPEHRPMDNVPLGIDDPQEDEYALLRLSGYSPLEGLIFPRHNRYFLLDYANFLPGDTRRNVWESAMRLFAAKISLHTGKRIVFKNPFHSLRIPTLKKLFPGAKFVHIYRDPRRVIPSTMHLWTVVGSQNALRQEWRPPEINDIMSVFDRIMHKTYEGLAGLDPPDYIEVKFEEFERDPVEQMKTIYSHFTMDYSAKFDAALKDLLGRTASYKKNAYPKDASLEKKIGETLSVHLLRGGYS